MFKFLVHYRILVNQFTGEVRTNMEEEWGKKQTATLHTFKIILFEVQLPLGTVHLIRNLLGGKLKTTTGRA